MTEPNKEGAASWRLYAEDEKQATVILRATKHHHYGERFLTMFSNTAEGLAQFDRPSVYYRTLIFLATKLDPIQFRRMSAREVAEGVGISQASAERALMMLESDKVLIHNHQATGAKARRLNNRLFWGSSAQKRSETELDPMLDTTRGR